MSLRLTAIVTLALFAGACKTREVRSAGPPPAVPVSVAVATQQSVPDEIRAIGTVEPSATVQIKSQIAGELTAVHFTEGANVNQGELLIEIDPRPYQEAVRQAEATVARDRAQLQQAEANLSRDEAQWKNNDTLAQRYESLMKEKIVSREQAEQMRTNEQTTHESVRADQAAIASNRAAIETDLAAVDKAKLDLSYCQIRSPITGRAGNLLVHAGNLVKVSDVPLVVINRIEPIYVSFGVQERYLAAIRRNSTERKLPVQASPQNDPGRTITGSLSVIDNTVDTSTGTIKLKATFDNHDKTLWPGQYVNARLTLDTLNNVTVVPSEAVQAGQQGQFIYVVTTNQTVERRDVSIGRSIENKIVVEKGIAPGETVVTDGQLRLFPGAHIKAVPADKLDAGAG